MYRKNSPVDFPLSYPGPEVARRSPATARRQPLVRSRSVAIGADQRDPVMFGHAAIWLRIPSRLL